MRHRHGNLIKNRYKLAPDGVVNCFVRERTIVMSGTIRRKLLRDIASALWTLQNGDPIRPIFFVVRSNGGCAVTALMIAAMLRGSIVPIYTHVERLAASSAVFIFLAGNRRSMASDACLGIHPARAAVLMHSAKNQRLIDYYIKTINRRLVDELRFATHMTKRDAAILLQQESMISANDALNLRLATDVLD